MSYSRLVNRLVKMMLVVALAAVCLGNSRAFAPPIAPEIDPGSFGSVIAVLAGSLALLERRSLLK